MSVSQVGWLEKQPVEWGGRDPPCRPGAPVFVPHKAPGPGGEHMGDRRELSPGP